MASGQGGRQAYSQVLSTIVAHKQESLQYLTVDNTTYYHWRNLARNLDLQTDCDVASFLLQHYEKTSEPPLTQCIQCSGPVLQYCTACNIYITKSTETTDSSDSSSMGQQSTITCDNPVVSGEAILINMMDVDGASSLSQTEQMVMFKTNDGTEILVSEEGGETASSNQLEALVEACALQGAIVSEASTPVLAPHTSTGKSLLTSEAMMKIKSRSKSKTFVDIKPEPKTDTSSVAEPREMMADCQALTSTQSVTTLPLTSSSLVTSLSQTVMEGGWSSDSQVNAVISGEGLETGNSQLPSDYPSTAETLLTASQEAQLPVTSSRQADELTTLVNALQKDDMSDDESDYYCEPLFKPSCANDKDLETTISAIEDSINSSQSVGQSQELTNVPDSPCLKVSQSATPDHTVTQSASADVQTIHPANPELERDQSSAGHDVESNQPATSTTSSQDIDISQHAILGPGTDERVSPDLETNQSESATSDVKTKETATSCNQTRDSATSDDKTRQSASSNIKGKSSSRKQKRVSVSPDLSRNPSVSSCKVPQLLNHTMRTRFFDKKRPSFLPTQVRTTSPVSDTEEWRPAASKKTPALGSRRRGRPRSKKKEDTADISEKEIPDHNEDEQLLDSLEAEEIPDSCKTEQSEADFGQEEKQDNMEQANTESVDEKDTKDLLNQILIFTGEDDLEKITLPKAHQASQPSLCGVKRKAEMPVPHMETNIAPVKVEPTEGCLSSKVSIVMDDPDDSCQVVRRKRRKFRCAKNLAKTYACDMCEEEMGSRAELKKHLVEQHGSRPYACDKCSSAYKCRSHLKVHLNRHANIKPFNCPHCVKSFASNYALTAHLTSHSTERPEVCDICGLAFKSAKYLKGHRRTHDPSDKPFICQQCGTRFNRKSNLNNHLKIHNNDKQYACPHCNKRFIQSGSMKSHVFRKHNPNRERPFVCDICGEGRYAKDQFEKHMMIHTGHKPFKCDICGAAFVQSNALKGHMKIHTETDGKANWCPICKAAFKKFASLKKHLNKVHGQQDDILIHEQQEILIHEQQDIVTIQDQQGVPVHEQQSIAIQQQDLPLDQQNVAVTYVIFEG